MATITFVKKTPAGSPGNFIYEYKCSCSDGGTKPNITVTCGNDNEAKELAQLECESNCQELASSGANVNEMTDRKVLQHIPVYSCNPFSSNAWVSTPFAPNAAPTVDPRSPDWQKVFTLEEEKAAVLRFDGRWRAKSHDWTGPYGYANETLPWYSYWEGKKVIQVPRLNLLIGVQVWFKDEYGQDALWPHPPWRLQDDGSRIFRIGPLSSWNMGIYRIFRVEVFAAALEQVAARSDDEVDAADPMRPVVV